MGIKEMRIIGLVWLVFFVSQAWTEDLYTIKSNVTPLNNINFQKQINNQRIRDVNVIFMYKEVNANVIAMARKYEDFANDYKRVFRIFYINCGIETKLCDSLKVPKYPAIRVYPPLPVPPFEIELGDILETKTLMDNTSPYLPKPDIEMLTSANINTFLEDKPDRPKVLLFSDRKTPSFMLKAIAHAFYDTMNVGFVQNTESSVVNKFKVTNFPSLILVRRKNEKPIPYNGEIKLNDIFDFLNIYAEKFVTGTLKDQLKEEGEKLLKPWLSEDIPELTRDSINDICLNTGKLCVIYLDTTAPSESTKTILMKFKEAYASENRFSYMWLNTALEKDFFKIFQLEESELPKVTFLNVGSLKRALIHSGSLTEESLQKTYDSIFNSDARFVRINVKTLPELSQRDIWLKTDL